MNTTSVTPVEPAHDASVRPRADACFTVDASGRFIAATPACTDLSGYLVEELLQMSWMDLCAPECLGETVQAFLQKDGQPHTIKSVLVSKTGERLDVEITGGLASIDGRPVIQCVARDNSRRRSVADLRQSLQQHEHLLDRITEINPSIFYVVDLAERRLVYLNSRQSAAIVGYTAEQLMTLGERAFSELMHPDDLPGMLAHFAEFEKLTDRDVLLHDYRMKHRDGTWHWFTAREAVYLHDAAGRPTQIIGSAVDVTTQKQAQEVLKVSERTRDESDRQLRAFFESAAIGAAQVDTYTSRFLLVNDHLCQITGYSREELLSKTFNEITHPDDRERDAANYQRLIRGEIDELRIEKRYVRKDGSILWVQVDRTPVRDAHGMIYRTMGVVQDITARREAEESIRQAKEAAEAASRAKDHFLAVLSHELRTPLTPVLAAAQMLAADQTMAPAHAETVRMIERNVALEARLIDDLLDLTRITRGKLQMRKEPLDMHDKIRDVVSMLARDFETRQIQLTLDLAAPTHAVEGDVARIQQIIWNLLTNAIKFTPIGGTVNVRTSNHAGCILVTVSDSGIGIEQSVLPYVFDAFEQGGEQTTRRFGGLGLGLTITRALVEMHGGHIAATSGGADQGSQFMVELPLLLAAPLDSIAAMGPETLLESARRMKILLVEDHADTRRMMKRLLSASGGLVTTAGGVGEAISTLSTVDAPFDLLICDIGLPDGSGLDIATFSKKRWPTTWCLALSGFGMEKDIQRSIEAGFDEHLTKPVDLKVLHETIARLSPH